MKTILVTGGAGYIGSHAVLALLESGERVVVLDNLSTDSRENVPAGAIFVEGDILDAALVEKTIHAHTVEALMHFAGLVKVEESVREPERYMRVNVDGTMVLARAAVEAGVSHFIFSSSASVYGDAKKNPIAEDAPFAPMCPYAETKMRAEAELANIVRGSKTHLAILRYFTVAGTDSQGRTGYSFKEKPTHLIRSAVRALVRGETFPIFGGDYPTPDGTCIRDFIHVSDLAEAHLAALRALREGSENCIYNCGSGTGYSNMEVLKTLQKIARREMVVHIGERRAGDPPALVADISRIKRELCWKPTLGLEDMIRDELRWVEKHL